MESVQRARGPSCVPGGLDEQPADLAGALLADPAVLGRLVARLADPRVKTEIGDQLPRRSGIA